MGEATAHIGLAGATWNHDNIDNAKEERYQCPE